MLEQYQGEENAHKPIIIDRSYSYARHVVDGSADMLRHVSEDIQHQIEKYGEQRVNGFGWISIFMEEVGEAIADYNKQDLAGSIKEARQAIACIARFIIELEREQRGLDVIEAEYYVRPQ